MPIEHGPFSSLAYEHGSSISDKLLVAIARSAEELTEGAGWPHGVHGLLENLGRVTGVSRVWIFQTIELTDSYIVQDYTFEWAAAPKYEQLGMAMFAMSRREIDNPEYRDMVHSRMNGEWQKVVVHRLAPSEIKENLELQGIRSMLTIPIMVEGQWWGTLGFDDCERAYEWTEVEIALLRTAAYLISNAVIRDRLKAKEKQSDILQTVTKSSAWELDLRRGRLWCTSEILYPTPGTTENLHFNFRGILRLMHPDDHQSVFAAVRSYLAHPEGTFRHDVRLHSDCGTYVWVELIGKATLDSDGTPLQFAGIAVDIISRKKREEDLLELAYTDHLTGVVNRASLDRLLQETAARSKREATDYSLLIIDVDHFKAVNDTHGHEVGDEVLRHIAAMANSCLRKGDILARIGGEEFVVLLPDAGAEAARQVGSRICSRVGQTPWTGAGREVHCTVSIGAATSTAAAGLLPSELMRRADQALYKAKKNGRDRLEVDDIPFCRWTSAPGTPDKG